MESRVNIAPGFTVKIPLSEGSTYVTVNMVGDKPYEVFIRGRKDKQDLYETIGRLVSLCLRSGMEVEQISKHLVGMRSMEPVWWEGIQVLSISDITGRLLLAAEGIGIKELIGGIMPDITLCTNEVCSLSDGCRRHYSKWPSTLLDKEQKYQEFEPDDSGFCKDFLSMLDMKEGMKGNMKEDEQ